NSTIVAPSVQQKQREASIEIVIPSVPLPIMTNNNQEFALNYSMVHDTFNTNILPLDVNISRSMEKVPTADNTVFYLQIVNAIHKIKALQDVFQKEINEKLNIMLEKVDQLITPEDSYWKLMMTKLYICHSDTKKGMGKKTTTVMGTTFTLAVCEIVLNPRHPKISVSDNALHRRFNEYLQNSKEIIADITKDISREELDESDKEQYENDGNIDQ
ncbi:20324_t:CDS:2, partial [Rhizophagus irregularis]